MSFLDRVEHELVRPILRWARPSRRISFAGIDISYRSELDGGGTEFGQQGNPVGRQARRRTPAEGDRQSAELSQRTSRQDRRHWLFSGRRGVLAYAERQPDMVSTVITYRPFTAPAGSTGRRNAGVKSHCWGFKLQGLAWPFV